MPRKIFLPLLLLLMNSSGAKSQTVRIGVLGIFHPVALTLSTLDDEPLVVTAGGQTLQLQGNSARAAVQIRLVNGVLLLQFAGQEVFAKEFRAVGRDRGAAGFTLAVPGKIARNYRGALQIKIANGELVPVITMALETAVASVVQSESQPGTPLEALKAQAVATRSYFTAGRGRHRDFDFCDLTHCQVLRDAPQPHSLTALAVAATRDLVIFFHGEIVGAMFTRSCGGKTLTPADIGIPSRNYPYFSVLCAFCHNNPIRWTQQVSVADARLLATHREAARLAVDRRLGWNAVLSNQFAAHSTASGVTLEGVGQGHGVGLCQRGARAMATDGASFQQILEHYFPNSTLGYTAIATRDVEILPQ